MYDPHTKDSRGFGFVMMMDPEGAAKAIEELSGKEFMGKIMTVAHVSHRCELSSSLYSC
jgi:RNA recognition motif-containing protein